MTTRSRFPPTRAPEAPEPEIEVIGARPGRYAAVPILRLRPAGVRAGRPAGVPIALSVQVMIEAARRSYDAETRERLVELFGPPERWATTTRSLLWTQVDVLVPTFTGSTTFRVPIACSYELEVAAAKYFHAVRGGEVPLAFNFNGTIYYRGDDGRLQMSLVPWSCSTEYRLPLGVWQRADRRTTTRAAAGCRSAPAPCDALQAEKARRGLPTFDACVAAAAGGARDERRPRAPGGVAPLRGLRALPVHARGDEERHAHAVRDRLPARLRAPRRQHLRPPARCECAARGPAGGGSSTAELRFLRPAGERHQAARAACRGCRPRVEACSRRRWSERSRSSAGRAPLELRLRLSAVAWTTVACDWRCASRTAAPRGEGLDRAGALRRSLISTHPILRVSERPLPLSARRRRCDERQHLAGARQRRGRRRCSARRSCCPTIPQLAPESLGNLFDSTEIEEALLLHVQALSDEERAEIEAATRRCAR